MCIIKILESPFSFYLPPNASRSQRSVECTKKGGEVSCVFSAPLFFFISSPPLSNSSRQFHGIEAVRGKIESASRYAPGYFYDSEDKLSIGEHVDLAFLFVPPNDSARPPRLFPPPDRPLAGSFRTFAERERSNTIRAFCRHLVDL